VTKQLFKIVKAVPCVVCCVA